MADWDSFSEHYDGVFLASPHYSRTVDMMIEFLGKGEGGAFLDLGCGTGNLAAAILDRFPGATVTGVDPSGGMIDKSTKRFADDPRVQLAVGDALSIPCGEKEFDGVVSNLALHHVLPADRKACATEVARVLKPGGVFVYGDMFCGVDAPPGDPERSKDIIRRFSSAACHCLEHGADEMAMIIIETLPMDLRAEGEYLASERFWVEILAECGFGSFGVTPVPPAECGVSIISARKE
jgi:ubiquinone/menaquinone biosynthesis C-methylase UbiE